MLERKKLPTERRSVTKKIVIRSSASEADLRMYVTAGMYDDGTPGEIFITADKVGSLTHGAFNAFAICVSVGLQHGVPLQAYLEKLQGMRFEPAGFTGDEKYKTCASVLDYVARWLRDVFLGGSSS